MIKKITTMKELRDLVNSIPLCADVQHAAPFDGELRQGVEVNYSEGTSWSNAYICFQI